MYEIFESLLKEKGLNANTFSKETGIAPSTLSDWKKGKSTPKTDKMSVIADYFGVTMDYLTNGKEPEFDEYDDEVTHLAKKIRKEPELAEALQKYFQLSAQKKKHVVELINLLSDKKE